MALTALTVDTDRRRGWAILVLSGRVDSRTAPLLEARLGAWLEHPPAHAALDLAAVDYVSSAGLRVLLRLLKAARRREVRLCLLAPTKPVRTVFDAAGFTRLFDVVETLEDHGGA